MKVFLALVAGFAFFGITYLLGSFVNATFDIAQWPQEGRVLVGVVGGMLSVYVSIITYSVQND